MIEMAIEIIAYLLTHPITIAIIAGVIISAYEIYKRYLKKRTDITTG